MIAKRVTVWALSIFAVLMLINPIPLRADGSNSGQWDYVPRVVHVPILMYHYIDNPPANADKVLLDLVVTPVNFTQQMQWLKDNGYTTISPDELMAALWHGKKLPPKPIMLTFDDGYANAWYNAFPILKKFGFSGVFFVITDFIDTGRPGYLSWPLAKIMVQSGMFIENHTRGHQNLKNRSRDFLINQIVGAQKAIELNTGEHPRFFCYPFGGYDDFAVAELQAIGLDAAFTENKGIDLYASNPYRMPRVRVRGATDIKTFAQLVYNGGL
ncbi:MAG: polysaccharide deacetylase family protein [Chloroflexota bacterium]